MTSDHPGPLQGIRVLDFTQYMQGPWATQLLGDMGADVVKVEPPRGDWERSYTFDDVWLNGESALFLAMNRNKRSIAIDLKTEQGRDVALRLAARADVLTENGRPGVMARLGLDYPAVQAVNPTIVYCSATGYGPTGPYADRPGQDLLIQALSGLASITGRGGEAPTAAGTPVADEHGARLLAFGVVTALLHRERTGEGQLVEVNLLDALLDCQCQELVTYWNGRREPQRSPAGIAHAMTAAPYGIYATSDGHLALAQGPLAVVADVVGRPELADHDSLQAAYDHRDDIKRILDEALAKETTDHWLQRFGEKDFWCARVNTYPELEHDPQIRHNGMITTLEHPTAGTVTVPGMALRMSATPGAIRRPPPLLGEHTEEILGEVGVDAGQVAALRQQGVVR